MGDGHTPASYETLQEQRGQEHSGQVQTEPGKSESSGHAGSGNCTILLVEDDPDICELVTLYLGTHAITVLATDGWDALRIVEEQPVDLVLLDIMLHGVSGYEICKALRMRTDIPILFVSANSEDWEKIEGLGVGGDDYIVKPFSPGELLARVQAHMRRYRGMGDRRVIRRSALTLYGLEVDEERLIVKTPSRSSPLSMKEMHLLLFLGQNPDRVFTPEELFLQVWHTPSLGDARTVMVHISNLRKKIEEDPTNPRIIQTIRGLGYKFQAEGVV